LATDKWSDLQNVKGIGWKDRWGTPILNEPERVVPTELMDVDLPGSAWDLLPYKDKPFDLYRSCNWHANYIESDRNPYAAIYTSLGCKFRCSFCMINILNRTDNSEGVTAENSNIMRFWSPEFIVEEFERLVEYGVRTIRISDEMFLLNRKYYEPLVKLLLDRGYGDLLNIWCYARVDTVNKKHLNDLKSAGINWLALGVESVDQKIRQEITKGSYKEVDIREVIKDIEDAGMYTIANYIFGLPDDDYDSMNRTLDTAIELNTETANMYPCFALPGSPLYIQAKQNGWGLPDNFEAWSFHSYEALPLPTKHLSAAAVLRFRDSAWRLYFSRPEYHAKIEKLFGKEAVESVKNMLEVRLRRKLLGD
jgi:anaerobic magnesium-protoporphyrin IX monomethyl ester cyclase